jgi:hypothetical protein
VAVKPPPQRSGPAVFLSDFVDVTRPLAAIRDRLCEGGDWLLPMAHSATDDGDALLVRVGPSPAGHLSRVVDVQLGECRTCSGSLVIPIRWQAAHGASSFPVLDGNLDVARLDDENHCRLALRATYRPPAGAVGDWLDSNRLHRAAESTVRSFLCTLAEGLQMMSHVRQ